MNLQLYALFHKAEQRYLVAADIQDTGAHTVALYADRDAAVLDLETRVSRADKPYVKVVEL